MKIWEEAARLQGLFSWLTADISTGVLAQISKTRWPLQRARAAQSPKSEHGQREDYEQHCGPQNHCVALRPGPIVRAPGILRVVGAGSQLSLHGGSVEVEEARVVVDRS